MIGPKQRAVSFKYYTPVLALHFEASSAKPFGHGPYLAHVLFQTRIDLYRHALASTTPLNISSLSIISTGGGV